MAAVHQSQPTTCHDTFIQRASPECSIIVDDVDEGRFRRVEDDCRPTPQVTSQRIQEFQRVAEGRKIEFARLLEEHAQVIRRLKEMEESEAAHIPATTTA